MRAAPLLPAALCCGAAAYPQVPSVSMPVPNAAAGAASCPIKRGSTKAVIYYGNGATNECRQWETSFYQWLGLAAVPITPAQLQDPACGGSMADLGVRVFAMPGGNSYNEQMSAGADGKAAILKFIDAGKLYVGTCAGFYYAASGYYWQEGAADGGEFHWPNVLGRFPEVEGSITDIRDDEASPGYKLTGLSNGLKAIYWGGPTLGWHKTSASSVKGDVLLTYSDVPGNLLAAVHRHDSAGNLLLFSAHLEAEPGVGITGTGLTKQQQLANWQYRATQITAAAGLNMTIPSAL